MVINFDRSLIGKTIYEVDADNHEVKNNFIITGFNYTKDGLTVDVIHPGTGYTFQFDSKELGDRFVSDEAVLAVLGVRV